jgi:serine-type D-Ala-D-Ala carboxypeptidase/endopeptidase (penicillin-binding protein 4)
MTRLARALVVVVVLAGAGAGLAHGPAHCVAQMRAPVQQGGDAPVAAKAGTELGRQIEGLLADPAVARAHWGVDVVGLDGTPIYALNEGQYFQPASNAKLFTTAAAMALLGGDATFVTRVFASGTIANGRLNGDLVLVGGGDANLSGRELPYVEPTLKAKQAPGAPPPKPDPLRYLEAMADQVAATGLKVVTGDVVGDDTLFPWEPYPEDWSIDDTVWGYGAPVSALTINDNQLKVTVTPGSASGMAASVMVDPAVPGYYLVDASGLATGAAKSGSHVQIERALGSTVLRVYGSIGVDAQPDEEEVAIQDPAEYAAMALKEILEARGIAVRGAARAKHRLPVIARGFLDQSNEPLRFLEMRSEQARSCLGPETFGCDGLPQTAPELMAIHRSSPLSQDAVITNKVSQNLHAELLLRQLGQVLGEDGTEHGIDNGTAAQGARVVRQFLVNAGVDKDDFVFFDGSGLSGHDLVTPRATVKLLRFAVAQQWFADWKKSLPVGGVDGSLQERFAKAPLAGHVFAKTGTLGEARALSGYLECASGRTVIFSIMVGNHAPRDHADRDAMDRIVAAIAASN